MMTGRFNSTVLRAARMLAAVLFLLASLAIAPAVAQDQAAAPLSQLIVDQRATLDQIKNRVDNIQNAIGQEGIDDTVLVDFASELAGFGQQTIDVGVSFRTRMAEINGRIEQLGPVPGEGQPPEPEIVATERAALTNEKAEINATIGVAEELSVRVNAIDQQIIQVRRDLFTGALSARQDIETALNLDTWHDFTAEMTEVYFAFDGWLAFALNFKLRALLIATGLALLAAFVLHFGGRRLFGNLIVRDPSREDVSYISRLSVAFWSTLIPSAALAVFLFTTYYLYEILGVMRGDIGAMLVPVFNVVATVFFIYRLARAVLSPDLPNWRLLAIRTDAANLLFWLVVATSAVTGLDVVMTRFNQVLGSPLSLTIAKSFVATIIVGVLVIMIGLARPYVTEDGTPRRWPRSFRYPLFLLGGLTIVAALLGFIGLARFVSAQMVVTGAILATMYLGYLSASAISEEGALKETALGRRLQERYSIDETTEDQLGLAIGILINIVVVLCGLPLILLQWGFQWADIQSIAFSVLNRITIGSVSFSLVGILTGVVVFLLGYFITRGFQHWLDGKVMARGKVDAGVRNSIRTAIGYLGIAVAALIGLSVAGIDLSNLALVAGALSLGIGFGLQNIVSNFVSGLILLAERPFKVGDWIVAGTTTGMVRKISVRATEIETFQKQTIILPNSELINAAVGNWTHKNKLGRVDVKVSVAFGSDLKLVNETLMDIARSHPLVLKNPEPFVAFTNILDYALEFELRVFLADILNGATVGNDIRYTIMERFEQANIGIPYAQRLNTVTIAEEPTVHAPEAPIVKRVPETPDVVLDPIVAEPAAQTSAETAPKTRVRARKPS